MDRHPIFTSFGGSPPFTPRVRSHVTVSGDKCSSSAISFSERPFSLYSRALFAIAFTSFIRSLAPTRAMPHAGYQGIALGPMSSSRASFNRLVPTASATPSPCTRTARGCISSGRDSAGIAGWPLALSTDRAQTGIRRPLLSRRYRPNSSDLASWSPVKIGPSQQTSLSSRAQASQMPMPHFMYRSRLACTGRPFCRAKSTTAAIIFSGPHVMTWANDSRDRSFSAKAGTNPAEPRDPYVIVVGVSRTISRRGTTCILGMGDPDRLRDRLEAGLLQEGGHFLRDLVEDAEAPREDRGADLDRARPRHDVLEGVPAGADASDADHGDVDLLADVVHGAHADRTDRGAAQPAEAVREGGHLEFRRDRHRLHRIDRDDAVRPALLRGDGELRDVLDVRGELREDGDVDDVLHLPREVPDRGLVLGDLRPEALRMRAGEIQFDRLHAVRRHLRRDRGILVRVLAVDAANHDRARCLGPLDLVLVFDYARIR